MRRYYLVAYDIADDKRLRKTHKIMKGYGEAWQYSVFFCYLKAIDRVRMEGDLKEVINQKEDQIVIVDLGANESGVMDRVDVIGPALPEPQSGILVV